MPKVHLAAVDVAFPEADPIDADESCQLLEPQVNASLDAIRRRFGEESR